MTAQFISPELAFDYAISQGHLSRDASSDRWVGHFMYMQSEGGFDWFKHRDTRELPHELGQGRSRGDKT